MADLRVSLLFEANTGAAKAGVAELREATADLAEEMRDTGAAASATTDGAAEWAGIVQMMRAQLQPMVAEAGALRDGMRQLAVAEEMGALTAREVTLAHDLLSRQMTELVGRMEAAGATLDGTTASVIRQDTALQQLINGTTGISTATGQSIADHLRHGHLTRISWCSSGSIWLISGARPPPGWKPCAFRPSPPLMPPIRLKASRRPLPRSLLNPAPKETSMGTEKTAILDTAALDALRAGIEALPQEVDGIDLSQSRQAALIQLDQLRTSVRILKKLSA